MSTFPTVLNDDDDSDDEDLMVNLGKDRRSGVDRRAQDPDSAHQFRQDVEREYRAEIRQLREEAHEKDRKIDELQTEITQILTWQKVHEPTLSAAIKIVNAGMVFRALIVGTVGITVGITATIGGISAMLEALKSWLQK